MFTTLTCLRHSIFAGPALKLDALKNKNDPLVGLLLPPTLSPIGSRPKQTDNPVVYRGLFRPDTVRLANQAILGSGSVSTDESDFDASTTAHELFTKAELNLGHSDNVKKFFSQLLTLRETPVVIRLMTSALMAEVLKNRHQYQTIDSIVAVIEKRHGEVSLGFFGKTKLLFALQPFLGKKDFFVQLVKLVATITGQPEGVIMLEILSFFFKLGHTSPMVKAILENFLKLLKMTF